MDLPPFTFQEVTEGLYLGSTPWREEDKEELYENDIRCIISLEGENDKAPVGAELFLWLPLVDNTAPTMDQLRIGIRTIDELLRLGKRVFVHCRFGVGRAPTMVAAHFVKHGMSVEEAVAYVHKVRPLANPLPEQLERLEEYREHVKRTMVGRIEPHRVMPKTMHDRVVAWKKTF